MNTLLKGIGYLLLLAGFILIMGAAGTSDIDPHYPLSTLILMSLMGLATMVGGALTIYAVSE